MNKLIFFVFIQFICNYPLFSQKLLIDEYSLLTLSQSTAVEKKLGEIKQKTGVSVCCYIARSLENKTPEAFTVERANTLKFGTPGINNAILIMIAPKEQQLFITMSYGVQWIIPDEKAESFIDQMTIPFRDKKYLEGILKGLDAMEKSLSGYNWVPATVDIRKADLSKLAGKVIVFDYTNKPGKWKIQHPVLSDAEFSANYKIGIYSDTRKIADLFYSKYMDSMINTILTTSGVKIFARVRKVNPVELELLGIR
jgi:uncharacterized membrane protein YgcG